MLSLLVCEPETLIAEALSSILSAEYRISRAITFASTLKQASCGDFGVILLSHREPDLNAMPWLEQFQALDSRPRLLLMVDSARSVSDGVVALLSEADAVLTRSASPDELRMAVRSLLDGGAYLQPEISQTLIESLINPSRLTLKNELTIREREVLQAICRGGSNRVIADELGVSCSTVKAHLRAIYRKLGVSDRTQASVRALRLGLTD